MEETIPPIEQTEKPIDERLCINCQKNRFELNYPTKLCIDCREQFINFPIPKWIWGFAIGILIVMIMGLLRMPPYLKTAMYLSKAEKAMDNKQYLTAQRELMNALSQFPENVEVNGKLIIASAKNLEFNRMWFAYNNILNKTIEDKELVFEIEGALQHVQTYFPLDTLINTRLNQLKDTAFILVNFYDTLKIEHNQDLLMAGASIANRLYDINEFGKAIAILKDILSKDPNYYPALSLLSACYRNTGNYDDGIKACDQMLNINKEDLGAISQKARIELKRKNDAKAAEYAKEAMTIDPENISALEAKAMVEFFSNKKSDCLKTFAIIQKKESETGSNKITNRLQDIINGKVIYR